MYRAGTLVLAAATAVSVSATAPNPFNSTVPGLKQTAIGTALNPRGRILHLPTDTTAASSMAGWTQLTSGASLGGPALLKANDRTSLIVRASDGKAYRTDINPMNPGGVIDAGAWTVIGAKVNSELNCVARESSNNASCAWLDAKKNVMWGGFRDNALDAENLLGPDEVGARPSLLRADYTEITASPTSAEQPGRYRKAEGSVWTGTAIYVRLRESLTVTSDVKDKAYHYGTNIRYDTDWLKLPGTYSTPLACTGITCVVGVGDRIKIYELTIKNLGQVIDAVSWVAQNYSPSPLVPSGLANSPPVLVGSLSIVRGKNGRIYQRPIYQPAAPWQDMGGATMAGSQFDCVAAGGQPTCFVQGNDGKVYWRRFKLGSAGAPL